MEELNNLRNNIDQIDSGILDLLNKRAEIVLKVADAKREKNVNYYIPEREQEILTRLKGKNTGPFPNEILEVIFKEIFCASLSLEQPNVKKVSYLGPTATFTHQAAIRHFGSTCKFIPADSIGKVFRTVDIDEADYGVVPIENSNEGIVNYTLDMFLDSDLKIYSEIMLKITHNLLSKETDLSAIKKIYSHPQPIAQCRLWLENNMLGVQIYESASTSAAAAFVKEEAGSAAIASELAAKLYNLNFLERHIEDNKNNVTRFLVISKNTYGRTGSDKTSLMFSAKDIPGSLYEVLAPFKKSKLNLTRIESRPTKKKAWDYVFFVDVVGHIDDKKVKKAITDVQKRCLFLKVLGSFPLVDF
jgi:chorismate mutase/prephenate dehydratase